MRLRKLVALGSLAASLVACGGSATTAPGGGGGSASAPASASVAPSTSAGGGASAPATVRGGGASPGDITALALAPTVKMCALLSTDEAKAIIGKALTGTPDGSLFVGLGTNCIWQTDDTMAPATFIKVEINPITYKANTDIVTLGGTASTQITVKSNASGNASVIRRCRSRIMRFSTNRGRKKQKAVILAIKIKDLKPAAAITTVNPMNASSTRLPTYIVKWRASR